MKKKFAYLVSIFLCFFCIGCGKSNSVSTSTQENPASSQVELTISAAASLKEAMGDIEPLFKEKCPNIKLTFNFGSSGSLQQQIEQGAPADIFISAAQKQMQYLQDKDLILQDSCKNLVLNKLVLVGPKGTSINSIQDLTSDSVTKIAVGEPSSVPAGKYADEVLKNSNIYNDVSSKLVFAKDVKEVLAWATSENAEVGFVYLSDALSNDSAKIIETIPENLHSAITYPIGIIKSTKNPDEAKNFYDFLYTSEAKDIFEKYGYSIVE